MGASLLWEQGLPAIQATRSPVRPRRLIASKLCSHSKPCSHNGFCRSPELLPTHPTYRFESSIRASGAACINDLAGIARYKKRKDPCGLNPRTPTCVLALK
ncbi:Hypothetical protein PSEBR_m871 [Pseudomonas brassicacearum subsp. brassicacearum NFM421]|uniref:Uncharacterized protein n=1 Tax=Pseudomonas brassicacearum (strain NFM421) TaxID=994484 RepID=F2KHB1_PSEBN|nr:Hypothetical protein PSEBR_m871 [Pseudomonas brassicacearum subsp. brassicacearum NFM421]